MDTEDTPPQTTKRMRLVGRLLRCCSLLMGIAGSGKANQHDHIYTVAGPLHSALQGVCITVNMTRPTAQVTGASLVNTRCTA
jgi:hypothetical protein